MDKLRILLVAHNIINNNAGAGKVHYELKEQYEKAGHIVEKVDILDLFPKGQTVFNKIFGPSYTYKLFKYLKKNATKYDVIDANVTNIIYPKEAFGFKGLLFARSQGIMPLYIKAEQSVPFQKFYEEENRKRTIRNRIGAFVRSFYKNLNMHDFDASVKHADIVHCLNQSEYDYFLESGVPENSLVLIPNGLSQQYLYDLESENKDRKNTSKSVAFIGAWHLVKGIKDWREISRALLKIKDFNKIAIIGTVMSEEYVKKDFDADIFDFLRITTKFNPGQLPTLLKDIKVGIFTSYMEGFGFAVLEKLASGIPVVAYKVPGISDFLVQIDHSLLVEPGDINELVRKASSLLELEGVEYEALSKKCIEVSKKYTLEQIVPVFLEAYKKGISSINYN